MALDLSSYHDNPLSGEMDLSHCDEIPRESAEAGKLKPKWDDVTQMYLNASQRLLSSPEA